jgi:hypothetical protein
MHDPPTRGLGLVEDSPDVSIAAVEHVVEQKGGSLIRRQALEQDKERDGEVRRELN